MAYKVKPMPYTKAQQPSATFDQRYLENELLKLQQSIQLIVNAIAEIKTKLGAASSLPIS